MDKEPITIKGLEKLKEELIFRKEKKRPEIVSAISEARFCKKSVKIATEKEA